MIIQLFFSENLQNGCLNMFKRYFFVETKKSPSENSSEKTPNSKAFSTRSFRENAWSPIDFAPLRCVLQVSPASSGADIPWLFQPEYIPFLKQKHSTWNTWNWMVKDLSPFWNRIPVYWLTMCWLGVWLRFMSEDLDLLTLDLGEKPW